jgi:hypothetical protein
MQARWRAASVSSATPPLNGWGIPKEQHSTMAMTWSTDHAQRGRSVAHSLLKIHETQNAAGSAQPWLSSHQPRRQIRARRLRFSRAAENIRGMRFYNAWHILVGARHPASIWDLDEQLRLPSGLIMTKNHARQAWVDLCQT